MRDGEGTFNDNSFHHRGRNAITMPAQAVFLQSLCCQPQAARVKYLDMRRRIHIRCHSSLLCLATSALLLIHTRYGCCDR